MDSNYREYKHLDSVARLDEIFKQPSTNYEEMRSLPDRDALTYSNGYYSSCSALFIDIRDSSSLPKIYNRPALAKLYRAFISEMVAILNGSELAREINIVGDCVWGVFNTPQKTDIDQCFNLAARANSLMDILNYKAGKVGYGTPLRAGIGISYGRALMVKAGAKGSGIAEVVYMGDVVNKASKLAAAAGGATVESPIVLDDPFQQNLSEHHRGLTRRNSAIDAWTSWAVNVQMKKWYADNCR